SDAEAAVHEPDVWIAEEAVRALLQSEGEALRALEGDACKEAIDPGPTEVEVMDRCLISDDKPVRRMDPQVRDPVAGLGQPDREAGADRSSDRLGRGSCPRGRRCERRCGEYAKQYGADGEDRSHFSASSKGSALRGQHRGGGSGPPHGEAVRYSVKRACC